MGIRPLGRRETAGGRKGRAAGRQCRNDGRPGGDVRRIRKLGAACAPFERACLAGCALALILGAAVMAQEGAGGPERPELAPAPADTAAGAPAGDPTLAPPPSTIPAAHVPEGALSEPVARTQGPVPSTALSMPQDLSPWEMFMAADRVVQAVLIGLALASLVTWTIWLAKSLEILAASTRLMRALPTLLAAGSLEQADSALTGRRGPLVAMLRAARHEAASAPAEVYRGEGGGFLARVSSHLARIEAQAVRRLNLGVGMLATIGATAPFVGLFGTVWGIMNSFIGISEAQTTNLAVVAPGIAEALLATALGLVAAIPAVVIYNAFARWIAGYRARLADAAAAVERLASRDLDHRRLVPAVIARAAE
ncbi:MAG: tonB-system energizer ExbB [Rhodobacteraceae bacterium]|nr:tonB-system energizer ExbB [Paracoccaceae bacterium]